MTTPNLHQLRVVDEHLDLRCKITRLAAFINHSPIYETLPGAEQNRLRRQLAVMRLYLEVLAERIQAFGEAAA